MFISKKKFLEMEKENSRKFEDINRKLNYLSEKLYDFSTALNEEIKKVDGRVDKVDEYIRETFKKDIKKLTKEEEQIHKNMDAIMNFSIDDVLREIRKG